MLFLSLFLSFFLFSEGSIYLNNVTIWMVTSGNITYMPNCLPDCRNKCYKCNLISRDCTFTDFLSINGMVKFYSKRPSNDQSCQRETLTISKNGLYRLTINSYHNNSIFTLTHTEEFTKGTIAVNFVLGYIYS